MRRGGAVIVAALLFTSLPARGANEAATAKAIDRGVAALKKRVLGEVPQGPKRGRVVGRLNNVGEAALAGLTLLECGIKPDDEAIKLLTEELRVACVELDHTYSLALAIMFFDRLGDKADVALIQSMGVRLLGGQNDGGGWSYNCPKPSAKEIDRLNVVRQEYQSPGGPDPKPVETSPKIAPTIPKELQAELDAMIKPKPVKPAKNDPKKGADLGMFRLGGGDNSNTQFAILGLWVSHRHGVPIEKGMAKVEKRFRESQAQDGSWGYTSDKHARAGGSGAMTCAGLLGLAMSHGVANEAVLRTQPNLPPAKLPGQPARDASIRAGLLALGTSVGNPNGPVGRGGKGKGIAKGFYFLWSVERVAVAYGLQTIGNKDWYAWGSEILLASQGADGSWSGEYGAEIDTSFALLFLRRVNLARDLTASIRGTADPGTITLKAGGVGGEMLTGKALSSGIVLKESIDDAPEKLTESGKLSDELIKAPANRQRSMIDKLKEGKGVIYTDALAAAIPQLVGSTRTDARDALAERLARMKASTLRDKLQDDDPEVRRAAAIACYMRDEKETVPDLIGALEDSDPSVARSAALALKSLTGQDHGPPTNGGAAERTKAVADWKAWWKKQGAK